jgi:tRNA-modifying protein YgfZ
MKTLTPLVNFDCIEITGEDAATFMQGQFTCDITKISEEKFSLSAYCNEQGRIVATGFIGMFNGKYIFITPKNLLANTIQKLTQYSFFSNVYINKFEQFMLLGCLGKIPKTTLPTANLQVTTVAPETYALCVDKAKHIYIFFGMQPNLLPYQEQLLQHAKTTMLLDLNPWEQYNIEAGIAHIYPDTLEKITPHMINYHNKDAISFTKGCFLGQEIIARTQHRGRSKRKLFTAKITVVNNDIRVGSNIASQTGDAAGIVISKSMLSAEKALVLAVISDHSIKENLFCENNAVEITLTTEKQAITA